MKKYEKETKELIELINHNPTFSYKLINEYLVNAHENGRNGELDYVPYGERGSRSYCRVRD